MRRRTVTDDKGLVDAARSAGNDRKSKRRRSKGELEKAEGAKPVRGKLRRAVSRWLKPR